MGLFKLFTLRFIRARKGRTVATVFGISLGIVMIVAASIVNRAALASFKQLVTTVAGKAELQALPGASSGFEEKLLPRIERVPGVKSAYPVVTGNSPVVINSKDRDVLLIYGVDRARDREVRDYDLSAGQFIGGSEKDILLTSEWASEAKVKPGDSISLLSAGGLKSFKVVGLMAPTGVGVTNAGKFAVVNMGTAQSMFARTGRFDQADISLKDGFEAEQVKRGLEKALGSELSFERPASRGKDVEDSMFTFQLMLWFTSSFAFIIGVFIIYNNVEMSIEERRFSIAMMRALGLRRKRILALVLGESGLLGLAGGFIGIFLGFGLARAMATAMSNITSALNRVELNDVGLTAGIIAVGLAGGVLGSVLASLPSTMRMLKIRPLEALVPSDTAWGKRNPAIILSGSGILLVGIVVILATIFPETTGTGNYGTLGYVLLGAVGLGAFFGGLVLLLPTALTPLFRILRPRSIPLRLGLDNLARHPGRTAATIAGMIVALSAFAGFAANSISYMTYARNWIDREVGWDMLVSSSFSGSQVDVPLDKKFGGKLRAIPGVEKVWEIRFARADYRDTKVALLAFQMDLLLDVIDFNLLEGDDRKVEERLKSGDYVAISSTTAKRFKLKAGDSMRFKSANGPISLPIAAVVKDVGSDTGTIYIDRKAYEKLWGDARIDGYELTLEKGYKAADVKKQIETAFGEKRHLTIRTHEEFKEGVLALLEQSMAINDLLVYIAILVAAVGIMNTSLISVWQRRREIATLRALGARRRLIKRMLAYEAMIMGATGALISLATGTITGIALVASSRGAKGMFVEYLTPWSALFALVILAIVLSALGSLLPARAGARSSIVDGIHYE